MYTKFSSRKICALGLSNNPNRALSPAFGFCVVGPGGRRARLGERCSRAAPVLADRIRSSATAGLFGLGNFAAVHSSLMIFADGHY